MTLKDRTLDVLLHSRDKEISGQELAEMNGVSRSAIWKAVNALRKEGWVINGGHGVGYRLAPDCDRLYGARIAELMDKKLPVYVYNRLDSTNAECKRRFINKERDCLIVSEEQTGGRGRRGKSFFSPKGGLYMSMGMTIRSSFDDVIGLTAYAAVTVREAVLELTGCDCQIKWVNDLYYKGKKVCGILTEAVAGLEAGDVNLVILGLGINLHPVPVPAELKNIVGFLDCKPIKNELAAKIALKLLEYVPGDRSYMDAYREHSIVLGREIRYFYKDTEKRGYAERIGDDGALYVYCPDGSLDILRGGEISVFLHPTKQPGRPVPQNKNL